MSTSSSVPSQETSPVQAENDAINFLMAQHREVEDLFSQIEQVGERAYRQKENLFEEIAQKLSHHAKIEEKIFYPEGKNIDEDQTLEAYEEHEIMKHMITRIRRTESRDETYMAKIKVLKEVVAHHVKEEEEEYFPQCREDMSSDDLQELGEEMKTLFERLESQATGKRAKKH